MNIQGFVNEMVALIDAKYTNFHIAKGEHPSPSRRTTMRKEAADELASKWPEESVALNQYVEHFRCFTKGGLGVGSPSRDDLPANLQPGHEIFCLINGGLISRSSYRRKAAKGKRVKKEAVPVEKPEPVKQAPEEKMTHEEWAKRTYMRWTGEVWAIPANDAAAEILGVGEGTVLSWRKGDDIRLKQPPVVAATTKWYSVLTKPAIDKEKVLDAVRGLSQEELAVLAELLRDGD